MSISSETTKSGPYLGDGVTVDFPITFSVSATTDVEVVRTPVATGIDEVITTGFTVDIATPQVTFDTAPTSAYKITLRVGTPYKQLKDLVSFGGVQAAQVEDMGDILTRQNLRQKEILDRVVKGSTTETADLTLPVASAGKALKWNDDADGFENSTYDPDEQVANAAAQVALATTQANNAAASASAASSSETAAETAQGLAEDARDEAQAAAAQFTKASQAEAEAGTDDVKYMTSLKTKQSIDANVVIASQAQAEAGTDNTTYMTPLRTAQAIAALETVGEQFVRITTVTKSDFTTDGNAYDWDLSGSLPANTKRILCSYSMASSSVADIVFRKNGSAELVEAIIRTDGSNTFKGQLQVEVDSNRVVEYIFDNVSFSAKTVNVLGYWI